MGGRCFIPPLSHPPLFSLASSPCSHSIPLPVEAESHGSGFAAQPTRELLLAGAGPEPPHRRCLAQRAARQSPARANAFPMQTILLATDVACPRAPLCPNTGLLVSPVVHAPMRLGIPGAPPGRTQAPLRHGRVIPAGVSRRCSGKDSGLGRATGQQHPRSCHGPAASL